MTRLLPLWVLCLYGCTASQTANQPIHQNAPESASLPTKPRTESKPSNELSYREVSIPGVTVELSAGQADAEMRAPLPWHQSLKSALQSRNGRASESLRCLSADLAAYISTHGNLPVPSTLRHLELRCGAKGVGTDILFEIAEVTEPLPGPAQLWEMWEGPLQNLVARATRGSSKGSVFGFSVYLSSPRTVAVLTRQESPYDVAIRSTDDNGVYVEGKYHEMVDGVALVATHGALGFHVCERDRSRVLPSFAFQCPPSEGDGTVAELFSKKRGRRMSNLDARFALSHQANLSRIPSRFLDVAALEVSDTPSGGPLWLSRLNALRKRRGLVPLQFQPEESRVITKALPEYLEALSDPTQGNKVEAMALAMLAGWHAEVPVIGGAMTTKLVESTDPNEWLSVVLSEPSARMVLMNPDASHIAGAFLKLQDEAIVGLSGLVVTYETLDPAYRDQSIESLRSRWGLGSETSSDPALLMTDARTAWIGRAERGEVDREGLLNGLLDLYATDLKCEVRVTVVETIDLEGVEAPAWTRDFDGTLLTDIAFMGRSTSTARTQWLIVVGLPSKCRR